MDEAEVVSDTIVAVETPEGTEILEIVDIEVFVREDREIPKAKKYRIRIDKDYREVEQEEISGRDILSLVKDKPDEWKLYEHKRGHQPKRIEPNEMVHLRLHKIERFTTMAKDSTEG